MYCHLLSSKVIFFGGRLGGLSSSSSSSGLVDASRKGNGRCSAGVGGGLVEVGEGSRNRVCLRKGIIGALLSYSLDLVLGLATCLSRSSKVLDRSLGDIRSLGPIDAIG